MTLTRCDRLRWNFAHLYRRSSNLRFDERDEKARRGCMFLEKSSRRNDRRQSRERALQNHHYHLAHTHTYTHTPCLPLSTLLPSCHTIPRAFFIRQTRSVLVSICKWLSRTREGPANPASVYSEKKKNIKAIRTRTRAAINWLASKSRMNVKDW